MVLVVSSSPLTHLCSFDGFEGSVDHEELGAVLDLPLLTNTRYMSK